MGLGQRAVPMPGPAGVRGAGSPALWQGVAVVRWFLPCLFVLSGCVARLLPRPPVVEDSAAWLRAAAVGPSSAATPRYEGRAPPLLLWGVDFTDEVLLELARDPRYGMIELARARAADGAWHEFALVSSLDGTQHVATGTKEAAALARAFPIPSYDGALRMADLRAGGYLERTARLRLPDGRTLQASVQAPTKGQVPKPRNGSAMNHSQDSLLAAIDLRAFNWGFPLARIDGEQAAVREVAPGLPLAWRLEQGTGGVRAGNGLWTERRDGLTWADPEGHSSRLSWGAEAGALIASGTDALATTRWACLPQSNGRCPWTWAEVRQGAVTVRIDFSPPLPDLRYPIASAQRSRFTVAIDAQKGLMAGEIEARHHDGGWTFDTVPIAPYWACERPVRTTLLVGSPGTWAVEARVLPELAAAGGGRERCYATSPRTVPLGG